MDRKLGIEEYSTQILRRDTIQVARCSGSHLVIFLWSWEKELNVKSKPKTHLDFMNFKFNWYFRHSLIYVDVLHSQPKQTV